MTTMIERVALVMCAAAHDGDEDGEGARDWNSNKSIYRDMARAAIAAMREPTKAMLVAGAGSRTADKRFESGDDTLAPEWTAMIDAALNEKES